MTSRSPLFLPLLFLFGIFTCTQAQPYWEDPAVYRLNKVQPHDCVCPIGSWNLGLGGEWKRTRPSNATSDLEFVYSRTFSLPALWSGRRTILKIPSPGTALYLYINDRMVGYTQDSRTPAEWDITRYLQSGTNRVACRVLPRCDGSRTEHPFVATIASLAPELISLPPVHISDVKILSSLDTTDYRTGTLDLMVDLNREVHGGRVEVDICGRHLRKNLEPRDWFLALQASLPGIIPWTDTTPVLYPLTIRLFDTEGRETERIVKHIGFRHLVLRDGRFLLNGQPLRLAGIRLSPAGADTLLWGDEPSMADGIQRFRQRGINALHLPFPAAEAWYDLCDSLGLLLFDQANVQTDSFPAVVHDRDWLNAILDRLFNLYKRDRNHPSVIAWSLGGGKANGWCMEEAYRFLKGKDNTRPVVYPGAALAANTDITLPPSASSRLPSSASLRNSRPFVPYLHCDATSDLLLPLFSDARSSQSFFLSDCPGVSIQLAGLYPSQAPADAAGSDEDSDEASDDEDAFAASDELAIAAAVCRPLPDSAAFFPRMLTDGLYADPDNPARGWVAWRHADTVELVLALNRRVRLGEMSADILHSPADSIYGPAAVQVRWSARGRRWSRWHSLEVQNPPSSPCDDSISLRYSYSPWFTRASQFVNLRFIMPRHTGNPQSSPCEAPARHLLIDEIEISEK